MPIKPQGLYERRKVAYAPQQAALHGRSPAALSRVLQVLWARLNRIQIMQDS